MKVILLRDVAKIGRRYDVVEVPDGFAQNCLIPKKDAEPATPINLKKIEQIKNKNQTHKIEIDVEVNLLVEKFKANPLEIAVEANEKGHLFKGINVNDVVDSAKKIGVHIPVDFLHIDEPIKEIGEFKITIKANASKLQIPIIVKANK